MKSTLFKAIAIAAIGATSSALVAHSALAANATDRPSATSANRMHHGFRGSMRQPLLRAIRQLDLSDAQKQSVQSLMKSAREQNRARTRDSSQSLAQVNPGDPAYAAAVQKAKTDAINRIQQRSDLDVQIYALLTSEQQAKLPEVLKNLQAKQRQRHQKRQGNTPATAAP